MLRGCICPALCSTRKVDALPSVGHGFSSTNLRISYADRSHERSGHNASASFFRASHSSNSFDPCGSDSLSCGRVVSAFSASFHLLDGMKKPPLGLLPLEVEPLSILFITPFYHVNTGTQENYSEVFLRDFKTALMAGTSFVTLALILSVSIWIISQSSPSFQMMTSSRFRCLSA